MSTQDYRQSSATEQLEEVDAKESNQEQLRILRVASDVYPDVMGGVGIHAHEMSKLQAEWGHEVTVLTSDHGDQSKPREETRDGYEIRRHRELVSPLDNSIFPGLVQSLLRMSSDYDVVHAHSHLFFSTNVTAAFRCLNDTPLVVTNHGLISQTAPKWLQKAFIPTVAHFTLNSADRILCYSETDKQRLRKRGIDTQVSVIHNGIDCEKFVPKEVDTGEGLQVLFVGRLKPGKGVDNLLVAFEDVVKESPEVILKIVGDGALKDDLVELAKEKGINSSVEFTGRIPNDEMPQIYSESDVFVLPSKNEGLPRTILESMACELPVIVSDLNQLIPVVDGAGIVFQRNDLEELSSSIEYLLNREDRRHHLGRIGRKRVVNDFSWKNTVDKTTRVYHTILND